VCPRTVAQLSLERIVQPSHFSGCPFVTQKQTVLALPATPPWGGAEGCLHTSSHGAAPRKDCECLMQPLHFTRKEPGPAWLKDLTQTFN
jgi:hypothetical protein